jgi:hypothetical protein
MPGSMVSSRASRPFVTFFISGGNLAKALILDLGSRTLILESRLSTLASRLSPLELDSYRILPSSSSSSGCESMLQTSNRGIANAGMPCSHTVLCRVRSSLPLLVVVRDGPGRVPATSPQRSKTGRLPALVQEASHGPIQRFRLKFCSFPIRRRPDGPRGCHLNNALCSVQCAASCHGQSASASQPN